MLLPLSLQLQGAADALGTLAQGSPAAPRTRRVPPASFSALGAALPQAAIPAPKQSGSGGSPPEVVVQRQTARKTSFDPLHLRPPMRLAEDAAAATTLAEARARSIDRETGAPEAGSKAAPVRRQQARKAAEAAGKKPSPKQATAAGKKQKISAKAEVPPAAAGDALKEVSLQLPDGARRMRGRRSHRSSSMELPFTPADAAGPIAPSGDSSLEAAAGAAAISEAAQPAAAVVGVKHELEGCGQRVGPSGQKGRKRGGEAGVTPPSLTIKAEERDGGDVDDAEAQRNLPKRARRSGVAPPQQAAPPHVKARGVSGGPLEMDMAAPLPGMPRGSVRRSSAASAGASPSTLPPPSARMATAKRARVSATPSPLPAPVAACPSPHLGGGRATRGRQSLAAGGSGSASPLDAGPGGSGNSGGSQPSAGGGGQRLVLAVSTKLNDDYKRAAEALVRKLPGARIAAEDEHTFTHLLMNPGGEGAGLQREGLFAGWLKPSIQLAV